MRTFKYLFLIVIFFLLSFMPVKAAISNFTGSVSQTIPVDTGSSFYVRKTDAIYDEDYQAWYYYYELMNAGGTQTGYICKFDHNFTALLDGCDNVYTTSIDGGGKLIDWNTTHIVVYFPDGTNIKKSFFTKNDLTKKTTTVIASSESESSVASDGTFVYQNTTGPAAAYGITYCSATGVCNDLFINANHFIDANKKYPRNLNWLYVPDTEEYYLFYTVTNGSDATGIHYDKAYLVIYDANQDDTIYGNQPKYLGYFQVSTEDVMTNFMSSYYFSNAVYWARTEGSINAKYMNGWVYWAYRSKEDNNQTLYFEAIDTVGTKNGNWLHLIKSSGQHINLSAYDIGVCQALDEICNTTAQAYSFDYIPSKNEWWFFYHHYNETPNPTTSSTSGKGLNLMGLKSFAECLCSDWVNDSSCSSYLTNQQKQTRICNPENCLAEEQYVDCTPAAPELHYTIMADCGYCSASVDMDKSTSATCNPSIPIPGNCVNITTTVTRSQEIDWGWLNPLGSLFVGNHYYNASVCNPPNRCLDTSYLCYLEDNTTDQYSYDSWLAGQNAVGGVYIDGSQCHYNSQLGWQKMTVLGKICYSCQKACGGNICDTKGLVTYSIPQGSDCTPNYTCEFENPSSCICNNGCSNGQCLGAAAGPGLSGNVFDMFFSMIETTFTGTALMFLALMLDVGISVAAFVETRSNELTIICFVAFLLFFSFMNWIPYWFGITIMIISVLFLGRKIFTQKGD